MNFETVLADYIPKIDDAMKKAMMPPTDTTDPFWGMMHYHLGWLDERFLPSQASMGKRLRPVFTLLACQAEGGSIEKALPAAVAVELLHNFSLVHDDIQDNSDTRRGRTTAWTLWGAPQSINMGDAMFTLARHELLKLRSLAVPAETILDAADCLDKTALKLCRGQYLDMSFEQTDAVSLEAYLEMIAGKTSALLGCSGSLGALIATNDEKRAREYWNLGHALGIAFQMQDDILGIWGESDVVGKPSGDDLRQHKKTLPMVFAFEQKSKAATRLKEIYQQSVLSDEDVLEATRLLDSMGAKNYTEEQASVYVARAEKILNELPSSPYKDALQEMAQFFIRRTY